jgi:hypothetical protein
MRIDIRVSSFESSLASSSLRASFPPKAASGSISRSSERSGLSCSSSLRSSMPRVESARSRLRRCGDTDRKPNHDQFPFRSFLSGTRTPPCTLSECRLTQLTTMSSPLSCGTGYIQDTTAKTPKFTQLQSEYSLANVNRCYDTWTRRSFPALSRRLLPLPRERTLKRLFWRRRFPRMPSV